MIASVGHLLLVAEICIGEHHTNTPRTEGGGASRDGFVHICYDKLKKFRHKAFVSFEFARY
jgi:hypothetical protein